MESKRVIGYAGVSNNCGLAILEIDEWNSRIKTQFMSWDKFLGKPGWCKVDYDKDGRAYFKKSGVRYYLDEIMRV